MPNTAREQTFANQRRVVEPFLRRYTELPALIHLLKNEQITLLDPQTWDDRNDSYYLSLYKQRKGLKTVLALCFTTISETYHHWRVFAGGSAGVCIRFDRSSLREALRAEEGIRTGVVRYLTLRELKNLKPTVHQLPFLKRAAFGPEREYRAIFESRTKVYPALDIALPLSAIRRVTLSPWLHPSLAKVVKETIKSIPGCKSIEVVRSTLIGNAEWKNHGDSAV
jgi:hypothetical protein